VLAFLLYNNALSIVQSSVQRGRLPFSIGLWIAHAVVALLIVLLFVRRVYWQRWLPHRLISALRVRTAKAG